MIGINLHVRMYNGYSTQKKYIPGNLHVFEKNKISAIIYISRLFLVLYFIMTQRGLYRLESTGNNINLI